TRVDSPGEQSRQVDDRERSRGVLEIEQELIPASVGRGIAAIVGLERPYGYSSQAEGSGVRRIGLRRHAFGLQMQERQSQRERIERRLAVVQEYQPSADSPPGVDDDVIEAHLIGVLQDRRWPNAGRRPLPELCHDDDAGVPGEYLVQLVAAGRHRNVPINIESDGAGLMLQKPQHRLREDPVRQRPAALAVNIAFRDRDKGDPRVMRLRRRSQPKEPIVGTHLEGLETPRHAQDPNAETDDDDDQPGDREWTSGAAGERLPHSHVRVYSQLLISMN